MPTHDRKLGFHLLVTSDLRVVWQVFGRAVLAVWGCLNSMVEQKGNTGVIELPGWLLIHRLYINEVTLLGFGARNQPKLAE